MALQVLQRIQSVIIIKLYKNISFGKTLLVVGTENPSPLKNLIAIHSCAM